MACSYCSTYVAFAVQNEQFIEQNDIVFIIIPTKEYEIYGIAEIDDISKIKAEQIVEVNINKENIQGVISDIYTSNIQQTKHKIKINFAKTENVYPSAIYKGLVRISETNVFSKIFR